MHTDSLTQNRVLNLRQNPTEAEKIIWFMIRNNQLGYKFRRQQPIDHYIVDFICFEKRLIVEIDGGQHNEETDRERSDYLHKQGFEILRFWNNDVIENKEGVFETIQSKLQNPLTLPSPARGEGSHT